MSSIADIEPIYNSIGKTYDTTRKADPSIVEKLTKFLNTERSKNYLDIGCGSGNYTGALSKLGLRIDGVDISPVMLKKAKIKYPDINWFEGDARKLLFQSGYYDGATCVLATHHIKDIMVAFKEVFRVLSRGRFVIFTATPEQCYQYWLREYFPKMIEDACRIMTGFEQLQEALSHAGFKNIQSEPYFVTNDLQDWFLHAGKYRPEMYLNPSVRAGISSFHVSSYGKEVECGLEKLKQDIDTGKIQEVIQQYENAFGDYLFVIAEKG